MPGAGFSQLRKPAKRMRGHATSASPRTVKLAAVKRQNPMN